MAEKNNLFIMKYQDYVHDYSHDDIHDEYISWWYIKMIYHNDISRWYIKMKVNNSEGECLTISLRGLIYDGGSNMHIKHISRLFILPQTTRLKTWPLMNIHHFNWQNCLEWESLVEIRWFSLSWELFLLRWATFQLFK